MRKLLSFAVLTLLLTGAGCAIGGGGGSTTPPKPVTLEYWRIQDDQDTMAEQIAAYKKLHPNVDIVYRKMREEDYEKILLEAFAENRGPDIFSIPNSWMGGWRAKILPIPKEFTISTQTVNAEKKIVTVKQKKPGMSILDMRNRYIEGITKDLIVPIVEQVGKPAVDKIWGIPLSADTLALFYNRDILRKGNFEKPPATWRDVQEYATKLTVRETADNQPSDVIKQSGAAIGTAKNVSNFVDVVAALMQQNGAVLADEFTGGATFSEFTPETEDKLYPPGVEALMFYQSFAQPYSPNYSWNDSMPLSFDAFLAGSTAFYFGFPSDIQKIRDRAPKLDFGLAPLPQVDPSKPSTILHYPVEVVAKQTDTPDEAWDFLHFLASEEQVATFLTAAKRPTALRSLIGGQLTDPDIAPFAGQVLTARAWYRGSDYGKVEEAFTYMINFRPTIEEPDYWPIVANAAGMVNTTMRFDW